MNEVGTENGWECCRVDGSAAGLMECCRVDGSAAGLVGVLQG